MNKLSFPEFFTIIKLLLVDILYPDFVHIPGLGIRMPYKSFMSFINDLYAAYKDSGDEGITLFFEKLKNNRSIISSVEKSRKIIFSHLNTLGIHDENEKQKYLSGIIGSLNKK